MSPSLYQEMSKPSHVFNTIHEEKRSSIQSNDSVFSLDSYSSSHTDKSKATEVRAKPSKSEFLNKIKYFEKRTDQDQPESQKGSKPAYKHSFRETLEEVRSHFPKNEHASPTKTEHKSHDSQNDSLHESRKPKPAPRRFQENQKPAVSTKPIANASLSKITQEQEQKINKFAREESKIPVVPVKPEVKTLDENRSKIVITEYLPQPRVNKIIKEDNMIPRVSIKPHAKKPDENKSTSLHDSRVKRPSREISIRQTVIDPKSQFLQQDFDIKNERRSSSTVNNKDHFDSNYLQFFFSGDSGFLPEDVPTANKHFIIILKGILYNNILYSLKDIDSRGHYYFHDSFDFDLLQVDLFDPWAM